MTLVVQRFVSPHDTMIRVEVELHFGHVEFEIPTIEARNLSSIAKACMSTSKRRTVSETSGKAASVACTIGSTCS